MAIKPTEVDQAERLALVRHLNNCANLIEREIDESLKKKDCDLVRINSNSIEVTVLVGTSPDIIAFDKSRDNKVYFEDTITNNYLKAGWQACHVTVEYHEGTREPEGRASVRKVSVHLEYPSSKGKS